MSRLITLSCPSCGTALEVSADARQFACQYCGSTHVLSEPEPDLISNTVVCPVGSHQDVILKVSAIIRMQVFEAPEALESKNQVTYRSQLAQNLFFPPRPYNPFSVLMTRGGILVAYLAFISLFAFLGSVILPAFIPESGLCGILSLVLIGVLIATPIGRKTLIPLMSKKNDEYQKTVKR